VIIVINGDLFFNLYARNAATSTRPWTVMNLAFGSQSRLMNLAVPAMMKDARLKLEIFADWHNAPRLIA
jgi:hypothetical protein